MLVSEKREYLIKNYSDGCFDKLSDAEIELCYQFLLLVQKLPKSKIEEVKKMLNDNNKKEEDKDK